MFGAEGVREWWGCGKARGMYSLGNRKEGAGGWSGGEPGKRGRGRGGLWGCVGEYAGKRGRARKMRERERVAGEVRGSI